MRQIGLDTGRGGLTAHIHYTYHAIFTGITHNLFTIRTAAFIKMALNQ